MPSLTPRLRESLDSPIDEFKSLKDERQRHIPVETSPLQSLTVAVSGRVRDRKFSLPVSFISCASSASITWERIASRRRPALLIPSDNNICALIGSNRPRITENFFVDRRVPLTGPDLDPLVHSQGYDYAAEPAAEVVADYEAHLVFS